MMPVIAMPDGVKVSFPDNMPASAIRDVISQRYPDLGKAFAKARLSEGLRAGERGDDATYRTAAFRTNQGVPAAGPTDAAIQGATLGFGDEISAAARAPIDMATRGESFGEAYNHNLAAERERLAKYSKENPKTAFAAEVAGGMRLPVGNLGPATLGAGYGALAGAGNSEGGFADRATGAAIGGATGAAIGKAVSGLANKAAGKGPSAAPTADELKAAAKVNYESEAVKGLEFSPKSVSDAAVGIRSRLDADGFDEIIASKAHGILKRLENVPDGATAVTGQNLRSIQKSLGKAAQSADPQEKAGATMALRAFNDFLEEVPTASVMRGDPAEFSRLVKEANANYSAAKTAESLDKQVANAELRAEAANSGMNVSSLIRQRMASIDNSPKLHRGMRPDEREMVRTIAKGTTGENLLRHAGNIAGGGSGVRALASGAVGYGVAGPVGVALPAAGILMRTLSNRMTLANAEKLSTMIRSRAPLASATRKFEERAAAFQAQRNSKTAAAAGLAARNLATNLQSAGIGISAAELLRALTPAQAKDENNG